MPSDTKRCSPTESWSSRVRAQGSVKTVAASANDTPCSRTFASAFFGSQSMFTICQCMDRCPLRQAPAPTASRGRLSGSGDRRQAAGGRHENDVAPGSSKPPHRASLRRMSSRMFKPATDAAHEPVRLISRPSARKPRSRSGLLRTRSAASSVSRERSSKRRRARHAQGPCRAAHLGSTSRIDCSEGVS